MGSDYRLGVPPGEAMRVTMLEYTYVFRATNDFTQNLINIGTVEVDALSEDTTLDLDITANPHTLVEVSGSAPLPAAGTPLEGANFYALVSELGGSITNSFYGAASSATPNGADVDYSVTYFEAPWAVQPQTMYYVQDGSTHSVVNIPGWPTAAAVIEFLPPPEIVSPAFGERHPLHDPIVVGRVAADTNVTLYLYDLNQDDRLLWMIRSTSTSTSTTITITITIPALPSTANRAELFPTGADLYVRPLVCEEALEGNIEYCARSSFGERRFDLAP